MDVEDAVKGYKVFNPDWVCRGKQYAPSGIFEEDVEPTVCRKGMHFCRVAADCFSYYDFDPENHVAEVAAHGRVAESGDKCCTDKLEVVREIPWEELLKIVNVGKECTGFGNSGNWNSGNWNSGNWNSGDGNSGNGNSGDGNSGNGNSGDGNSGDWNKSSYSNGCFNTKEQKIYLFDKPSEWTMRDWLNSGARSVLGRIPGSCTHWIDAGRMTEEEKATHPEYKTTGGFLRQPGQADAQAWWDGLPREDREAVCALPNFDRCIFLEVTGIDVGAGAAG